MPSDGKLSTIGRKLIGRARATWRLQLAAAIIPPLVAFVIQWYFMRASIARWALFYPAVFVSSWVGGLASGLGATAVWC